MVVVVKCKRCGQEFPSKLVQTVNEQGLKNFTFESNKLFLETVKDATIVTKGQKSDSQTVTIRAH